MIRYIFIVFIFCLFTACLKEEAPDAVKDIYPPAISPTSPSSTQLYNKKFPIHITGSVVDSNLLDLKIVVVDSNTSNTLYSFTPNVVGKTGYIYNEQYYAPADSGFKHVIVTCTDGFHHTSVSKTTYFVY